MTLPIPVLDTERLTLRAPLLGDLKAMAAFFETRRSHMVGGPRDAMGSYTSLISRLGHWVLNGYGLWHIIEKTSGAFIGWTGVIFAPAWSEPELGGSLCDGAEGKGYAFEAATAARRYAASHQNLNGVVSYIAPENARSMALAARLGAHFERDAELLGKPCQIWRHPKLELPA
jgi:RimJ/RimL family protein N-acetyltransferase